MIDCQGLTKTYGHLRAVDDLTFHVQPGEVLGFLGPNGAGKSTTMRSLAGFLPRDGRARDRLRLRRRDAGHSTRSAGSAICPKARRAIREMTPRSFLEFIASAREARAAKSARRGSTR